MTLQTFINRHSQYLARCPPKAAPYVKGELLALIETQRRIQQLEDQIKLLSELYTQTQEAEKILTEIFIKQQQRHE